MQSFEASQLCCDGMVRQPACNGDTQGGGVWHWGAAKDLFLPDAFVSPATSDSSGGSGSDPVGQGELCAQLRDLCIMGGML